MEEPFRVPDANKNICSLSGIRNTKPALSGFMRTAADQGLEPQYPPPKGGVLPLDESASALNLSKKSLFYQRMWAFIILSVFIENYL